jgi:protein gp37
MAKRLKAMGQPRYSNGFRLTLHEDLVDLPLHWRSPKRIFINSMSDLFHKDVPDEFIQRVFRTMNLASHHTFQVLTKRPERVAKLEPTLTWTQNIWLGTSIEDMRVARRIDYLKEVPAHVRFLSCEPLLGSLHDLDLSDVQWVIAGGESGPGARPMDPRWPRELRDKCTELNIPYFFKQWGGVQKHRTSRILDGQTWDEMPQGVVLSV